MIKGIKVSAKNDVFLDLLRLLACICVIGIHTPAGTILFSRVARLGLPIFFLLSGYFLLPNCDGDHVLSFYGKRFEKVVLPFLCYGIFYGCWIYPAGRILARPTRELIVGGIKYIPHSLLDNLNGSIYFHFWFMYELIALYLIFPFLGQGLKALSDRALRSLLILMLVTQFLVDYLPLIGREFPFQHYFGWLIYIIFGYALSRECFKKWYPWLAVVGLVVFAIQLLAYKYTPGVVEKILNTSDLNPWEVLPVCGIFAAFMMISQKFYKTHDGSVEGMGYRVAKHVIGFLATYTFSVYLIHGHIISWWCATYQVTDAVTSARLFSDVGIACAVFGLSLLFAIVFDNTVVALVTGIYRFIIKKVASLF